MTSRGKSTFASKRNTEYSSQRDQRTQEDKSHYLDSNRNQLSAQTSNMLNSNNTNFSYMENLQSNGDNFIEFCDDLNRENKEKNEQQLQDYLKKKANQLTREFVNKVKIWDQQRIQELQDKLESTESTGQTGQTEEGSERNEEIVEKRIIYEQSNKEFLNVIRTFMEQCTIYIELVAPLKQMSDELKIRLTKIYT